MKLSLSKLILSVAALLCLEPISAQAQTKRSLTDSPVMSQWLAEDALTFAQTVYDTFSLLQTPNTDRLVPASTGCGWMSYPSDYGCYTYDFGYQSPADYSPLATRPQSDNFVEISCEQPNESLCGIPCDIYPCTLGTGGMTVESSLFGRLINDAVESAQEFAAEGLAQCEVLAAEAGDTIEESLSWLADQQELFACEQASAEPDRLVIQPLEDVETLLNADVSELQFAEASAPELIDYEWQVTLEHFAKYGSPSFLWDDGQTADIAMAGISTSPLKLWISQAASQAVGNYIASSDWYIATADAIASIQSQHDEMLTARTRAPAIPAEEFLVDETTFVNINTASQESIPSLARAVIIAVRFTWTGSLSTAAAGRIMR